MERHNENAKVVAECADCVRVLAGHAGNRAPLRAVVPQLRAALDRHPGCTEVQGAIRALS
jgi:hypothetical protein